MELRQLRYFLAVAEELHFGRAAERLHVSQPPLSVAIRALERELGAPLFERSTRRVALTPAGEHLRDRVAPLVAELDAVVGELADVREGIRGRLRVGYVSSASYSILPGAMRRFQRRLPRVDLRLVPLTSGEQLGRLLDGGLDADGLEVGILRDQTPVPGLGREHVLSERLLVVMPERHPLAALDAVEPRKLEGEPMILFPYELMPGYLSRITVALGESANRLSVVQRTVHQETVLGLVAAGVGLSVLPESVTRAMMPGVVARPLETGETSDLQLAWRDEPGPAARVFAECVHAAAEAAEEAEGTAAADEAG